MSRSEQIQYLQNKINQLVLEAENVSKHDNEDDRLKEINETLEKFSQELEELYGDES